MVRDIIKNVTNDICTYNNFSEEKTKEIEYVMVTIAFEIIKMLGILITFSILGYFKECLAILLMMMCIRPFIGGYHEDTQLKCFLSTTIIVFVIIYLSNLNQFNLISIILLNSLSIFSIYHRAPVINDNMIITKESLIKRNKIVGTTMSIVLFIMALILKDMGNYSSIITWTILVQVCLMFNKN